MNRNFGKVKHDNSLEYAPDAVRVDGRIVIHPQAEQYAQAADGPWLPNVDEPPPPPREGHHWESRDWREVDGQNVRQYVEVADPPPPPRVFRRSWLAQWIYVHNKWAEFQAFLADPDNEALAFMWSICTEFDEDAPQWPAALAAIKAALALTDEQAEEMLDFGATGGQP